MFLGGQWVDAVSGAAFDDLNPYTGEVYARVPKAGTPDAERGHGRCLFRAGTWANTAPAERARLSSEAARILEAHRKDYADILITESGSTFLKAMSEVTGTVDLLDTAAADWRISRARC